MSNIEKILVGKIVAPHGIRGDVRVLTYSEKPQDFQNFKIHSSQFDCEDFKFIRVIPHSNTIIAHINGFDDRNMVENLRGVELFVLRNDLPKLWNEEYYQSDLIGLNVVRDGIDIGRVVGFYNFGAGDIMETDTGEMVLYHGCRVDIKEKKIYK